MYFVQMKDMPSIKRPQNAVKSKTIHSYAIYRIPFQYLFVFFVLLTAC